MTASVCVSLCAYECTRARSCLPGRAAVLGLSVTLDESASFLECARLSGACLCVRTLLSPSACAVCLWVPFVRFVGCSPLACRWLAAYFGVFLST